MCRVLTYLGPPAKVANFLYASDNALIRQSYEPQLLGMLNLGGFGMLAWDGESSEPGRALSYRTADLPIFDRNLESIAEKFQTTCLLAHIRGIAYRSDAGFGPHNLHPFHFGGERWAMAHNGDLHGHPRIRHSLLAQVDADIRQQIDGTTDSEMVYALVVSALRRQPDDGPQSLVAAIRATLREIAAARSAEGLDQSSSLNLFFSDGRSIVGLRYCFDFGKYPVDQPDADFNQGDRRYLSLWYTLGESFVATDDGWQMAGDPDAHSAVIVASEPLTRDVTGWVEVPEYTFLVVEPGGAVSLVEV